MLQEFGRDTLLHVFSDIVKAQSHEGRLCRKVAQRLVHPGHGQQQGMRWGRYDIEAQASHIDKFELVSFSSLEVKPLARLGDIFVDLGGEYLFGSISSASANVKGL